MNKRLLLSATGLILVASLFFFGRTVSKKTNNNADTKPQTEHNFNITQYITAAKQKLTTAQALTLGKLENSVTRGDVAAQQIAANNQLCLNSAF